MPLFKKRTPKTSDDTKTDVVAAPPPAAGNTARFGGPRPDAAVAAGNLDTARMVATPASAPAPASPNVSADEDHTVMLRRESPPAEIAEPVAPAAEPVALKAQAVAPPEPTAPAAQAVAAAEPVAVVLQQPTDEPPDEDTTPLAFIIERNGANVGKAHCLDADTILGRSAEAAIFLGSEAASKRHANIRYRDGAFIFWDLASANYSFLVRADGQRDRVLQPHRLTDGDTLDLADARVTFIEVAG